MSKKNLQSQKEELFARKSNSIRGFTLTLILLFYLSGLSVNYFTIDSSLKVVQKENIKLRLESAKEFLLQQKDLNPRNSAVEYLLHFNAYLKVFITEDQHFYNDYVLAKNSALNHYNQLSDSSPFKKFAQSEIHFYSATLLARQGEYYNSAMEVRKAWNLIEDNHQLFPDFLPNNKTRGVLRIYLSTIPENYNWIIRILGFEGDLNHGLRLLETLSQHESDENYLSLIAQEASYLYSFSLLHAAKNPVRSWNIMLKCTQDYKENLLSNYFRSSMALKLNKNNIAFKTLTSRPYGSTYEPFYLLSYYLGVSKLYQGDSTAINDLKFFIDNYEGEIFLKSAHQKISWYYILKGDYHKANLYKSKINYVGKANNNEDKQASRYVNKENPHSVTLKSRLLYDGGYYREAYDLLHSFKVSELKTSDEKAEFCYRKGRVLEKLGLINRALIMYEACSLYAVKSKEYYGAYACLYLGDLYAKDNNIESAIKFYNRAKSFAYNEEYVDTINNRAEAGINELQE